jgi:hypothetical protein
MNTITPAIRDFFDRYAGSRTAQDIDAIASQYPDAFMTAGPNGARVAQKSAVIAGFPKGQEFLKSLGHESTEVVSLHESRMAEHFYWFALRLCGVFAARLCHPQRRRWTRRSYCTSTRMRPGLSFNTSTKSSSKRCERAACCRPRRRCGHQIRQLMLLSPGGRRELMKPPNTEMEPTRQLVSATVSLRRAAHSARSADTR